jgi:hypothetical protein
MIETVSAQNKVESGAFVYRLSRGELQGYIQTIGIGSERNTNYPGPLELSGQNGIRRASTYVGMYYVRNDTLITWTTTSQIAQGLPLEGGELTLWENYNFAAAGPNVPEEIVAGKYTTYTGETPTMARMHYESRNYSWSVPKYDDFFIQEIKITNAEPVTIHNFHVVYSIQMFDNFPSGAGNISDTEYIWDEKRNIFIFYDANHINPITGVVAEYSIAPGDVTGDVGDPGNINNVGSNDYQLYTPYAQCTGFLDVPTNALGNNAVQHWISNINWENSWYSDTQAPAHEFKTGTVTWNAQGQKRPDPEDMTIPMESFYDYPQAKMSYLKAAADPNVLDGNVWERHGAHHQALGPYTLEPGESISYIRIVCAGRMDPNEYMRGGLEATKKLDLGNGYASEEEGAANEHVAIKDCRKNWDSALEMIANNYAVTENVPPPTPGIDPLNVWTPGFGNVVAEQSPQVVAGAEAAVAVSCDAVHQGYTDPLTGQADFKEYRIYQSDISLEGPWILIDTISASEADGLTSGDRITKVIGVKAGVPYYYMVTTMDNDGNESGWSGRTRYALSAKLSPSNDFAKVKVIPNPFKQRSNLLDPAQLKRLNFINIPSKCTIRIYNLYGELMITIEHDDGFGEEAWGSQADNNYMLTKFGQNVMPGLYIYLIESHVSGHEGETATGKFVIIK